MSKDDIGVVPMSRTKSLPAFPQDMHSKMLGLVSVTAIECNSDSVCRRRELPGGRFTIAERSPQSVKLQYSRSPKQALIVCRRFDDEAVQESKTLAKFLKTHNVSVVCESWNAGIGEDSTFAKDTPIDFVVCVGGDGTFLTVSQLFQGAVPVVVAFAKGSLGFLTNFDVSEHQSILDTVLNAHITPMAVTPRMRLSAKKLKSDGSCDFPEGFTVLNEVVVTRGNQPCLGRMDLLVDGNYVTTVYADGLIIATPTGSTAYSMAAGGSMVCPDVPGIVITPICPHSLSFRPLILPDCVTVTVQVPEESRSSMFVQYDNADTSELKIGDAVQIHMSEHPLPSLSRQTSVEDWFRTITDKLHWNIRHAQKPMQAKKANM